MSGLLSSSGVLAAERITIIDTRPILGVFLIVQSCQHSQHGVVHTRPALREIRRGFYQELRGTNFYAAIRTAHAELGPSPGEAGDGRASREDRERSILFFSDGVPTLPIPALHD